MTRSPSPAGGARHGIIRLVPQRSRTKVWVLFVLFLLLAVVGSASYLGWRQTVPGVQAVSTPPRFLGQKTPCTLSPGARRGNVTRVEVRVVQSGTSTTVAKQEGPLGRRVEIPLVVESGALGLREGTATLEVRARDDFWRPLRREDRAIAGYPVTIDLTPPKIELLAATRYLSPGGTGLVAFRVTGAARTDLSAGPLVFPSFAYGPEDRGARVALIALPWDFDPAFPPRSARASFPATRSRSRTRSSRPRSRSSCPSVRRASRSPTAS